MAEVEGLKMGTVVEWPLNWKPFSPNFKLGENVKCQQIKMPAN